MTGGIKREAINGKNKSEKYTYLRNIALSMMTEAVNTIEFTDTNILIDFNKTFQQRLTLFHILYKNISKFKTLRIN